MAYDVNSLKDRAQCLEAKASLEAEIDGYQNRDQNLAYQDRREDRAGTSATSRLATATDRVSYLTDQLARPDLAAADRRRYEDQMLTANYQKARLQNRTADSGGAAGFLADVDSDQIDAQVTLLDGAIAAVQARHDALPAQAAGLGFRPGNQPRTSQLKPPAATVGGFFGKWFATMAATLSWGVSSARPRAGQRHGSGPAASFSRRASCCVLTWWPSGRLSRADVVGGGSF